MTRIIVVALCVFVSLGALIFGMDGGYLSGVLAMPNFIEDFGRYDAVHKKHFISASQQSFITSFPYVGQFLAALSGGTIGDRFGRRWGLFVMCVASVVGVVIQIVAKNEALFIVGRFFNCELYYINYLSPRSFICTCIYCLYCIYIYTHTYINGA